MKKIAYVFTKQHTGELMEDSLLLPIALGQHGAKVVAMYFIEDGVYQLMKGGRSSKNLKTAINEKDVKVFGCKISIKNRNLQNVIIDGVHIGEFNDFFQIALEADHIISF
ncbi:MAG: DsrE family protein [Candidatus Hodarchaeota archaeon]